MSKHIVYTSLTALFAFILCGLSSCKDELKGIPEWEWGDDSIVDTNDPANKPRYVWIDAAANFHEFANSKENIARDLALAKATGFTDIVVDVRPTTGYVLFNTNAVDQVKWLDHWTDDGRYIKVERTETWDYLQEFIDQGHKLELRVHAAINTFVGGIIYPYGLGEQGMLISDPSKKEWATTLNLKSGRKNAMDLVDQVDEEYAGYTTKFFNPVNENVQTFILTLIADLAKYNVDGIFLDRARFDNLVSDFSDYTKTKFEAYIGQSVTNFPGDVAAPGTESLPTKLPVHMQKWLEFRAKTIHDFMTKAQSTVKSANPKIDFGVYVGAWYSSYYESGVNWASPSYDTKAHYPKWATAEYKNFGYADLMDFMLLGAYASANKVYGDGEWTVQGFCKIAREKLIGTPFAGGPDVGNWEVPAGTDVGVAIANTVDAAINASDGYFLFDMCHLRMYDYWKFVKTGIQTVEAKYKEEHPKY